ncbi:MAG: zinc ribbon domain-containing protein [Acidobacteria bacterium]|nr:zinc ribbon domain-containing protein [Acidobacteriota bacterium]
MPLYEYQCDACGHRFEKIQKFSDAREDTCPKCGGIVRKLISSPAIQFKGSGFYITDYAKKDYTDASRADGKATEEGKSDSGKTDKTEKTEKSDKSAQADTSSESAKSEKSEKTTSSSDSTSASDSTPASTTKP